MKLKLTAHAVDKLKAPDPSGKQTLYWDEDLSGFGVLVSSVTSAKSYVVQADLKGGKTRRVTIGKTNVISLKQARNEAKAKLADMLLGVDPKAKNHSTLAAALSNYLETNKQLRPKSVLDYRHSIEGHLSKWLNLPLTSITTDMVVKRHHTIVAEVKATGRGSGEATANGVMRCFRAVWNFASGEPNPTRRLKWYKINRRTRHLTADMMPRFYKAVRALPSPIAADYLTLLLFTGLRREEAASLTWKEIDFEAKIIRIPGDRTKNGLTLNLPMTDFVYALLKERAAIGRDKYLFPSNSESGYISEPKYPLNQVRLATGINISPHDLRRSFATAAADCGVRHQVLKVLLNHAPSRDVTDGYAQITPGQIAAEAQRVCDRLKELCRV
jgi:site-specific recombinase XerD